MIAAATFTELLELEAVQRSFAAVVLASLGLPIAGVLIVGLDVITARFAVIWPCSAQLQGCSWGSTRFSALWPSRASPPERSHPSQPDRAVSAVPWDCS